MKIYRTTYETLAADCAKIGAEAWRDTMQDVQRRHLFTVKVPGEPAEEIAVLTDDEPTPLGATYCGPFNRADTVEGFQRTVREALRSAPICFPS